MTRLGLNFLVKNKVQDVLVEKDYDPNYLTSGQNDVKTVDPTANNGYLKQSLCAQGKKKKSGNVNINRNVSLLYYLTAAVGNTAGSSLPKWIPAIGGMIWFTNMIAYFAFDCYEAKMTFGYVWLTGQIIQFSTFIIYTYYTNFRTIPWFVSGLKELEVAGQYKATLRKVTKATKALPPAAIAFALVCAALKYVLLILDKALQLDFGTSPASIATPFLHIVRFINGFHVYLAISIFWNAPVLVMLMTGYSMQEYMDEMGRKLGSITEVPTFKDAIQSYNERAKFVKNSSASCIVSMALLLISSILTLGLNAYMFFFQKRRFVYLFHAMLPLILMVYPICTAAWVTKQYNWFIIVVVKAWIGRDDSDSEGEEDKSTEVKTPEKKKSTPFKTFRRFSMRPRLTSSKQEETVEPPTVSNNNTKTLLRRPPSQSSNVMASRDQDIESQNKSVTLLKPPHEPLSSDSDNDDLVIANEVKKPKTRDFGNLFRSAAKAIGKLRKGVKPKFNFDKFLSYLDSMRPVVGFTIGGIMVTWELVSTILFLLFSLFAVFIQESIFGDQKSTI